MMQNLDHLKIVRNVSLALSHPFGKASARCLDLRIQPNADREPPVTSRGPRAHKILTFKQVCRRALDHAVAISVLLANSAKDGVWCPIAIPLFFQVLLDAVKQQPVVTGITLADLAGRQGLDLIVGVFDDFDRVGSISYCDQQFPTPQTLWADNWRAEIISKGVKLPGKRRVVNTSDGAKLLSTRVMGGPYIGIFAIDEACQIVRGFEVGAWIRDGCIATVGSGAERMMRDAADDCGAVVFPVTHTGQYRIWQRELGHLWLGDISKIPFVADGLLMPPPRYLGLVADVEVYGLRGFDYYFERKDVKDTVMAVLEGGGLAGYLPISAIGADRGKQISDSMWDYCTHHWRSAGPHWNRTRATV